MIVVSLPAMRRPSGGFGQLAPEEVEAELSRRGVYRAEEGVPALPPPEAPAAQVIVVPPEVRPPTYIEPYLPVIPRGEEPTPEEWQQYAPYAPPEAPPEKKPISKTALIAGAVIFGGLMLFGSRATVEARPRVARRITEEFPPAEEGEYEF